MSEDAYRDRTLALAGLFQSSSLVTQVAREGKVESAPYEASIDSIFAIDAPSTEEVYGGVRGLAHGLHVLRRNLGSDTRTRDPEVLRYVISLLHLERKLIRKTSMLDAIRQGIEQAKTQATQFSRTHPNVIARLADLYMNNISPLGPRIMVRGEPSLLHDPHNANRIRALLLAGIRAAVLWRQVGGSRIWLLFFRQRILESASRLSASLIAPVP